MGKIKSKMHSLKWSFFLYLPICLVLSYAGSFGIGVCTNYAQDWYEAQYPELFLHSEPRYQIKTDENGILHYDFQEPALFSGHTSHVVIYQIISYTQVILIPLWVVFCIGITGIIFYNRELKKPINILLDASEKIAENQLDFQIQYSKNNELGILCNAFEEMRSALYENNREMWLSLEERKRLNSAFSHDLRTPLTVLRGYSDFLLKYIPEGKVPEEKLLNVLSMMNGQIVRLEHYTQKMNAVQKLEDIVPQNVKIQAEQLHRNLSETGELICTERQFKIQFSADCHTIFIDPEIVMQVYENLVGNACRYAQNTVEVYCDVFKDMLTISVRDDGNGFTGEALKNASEPFFRDEKEPDKTHFGLGLYICRILCAKCGGQLTFSNHENGGGITNAEFFCGEILKSR